MDLFPLLLNKLSREGLATPSYIGEWPSVNELPKIQFPPIYYWINSQIGSFVLSFNEPMLEKICFTEAYARFGETTLPPTNSEITQAIDQLKTVSQSAFEEMIQVMLRDHRNKQQKTSSLFINLKRFFSK